MYLKSKLFIVFILWSFLAIGQEKTSIAVVGFFTPSEQEVAEATRDEKLKIIEFRRTDYSKLLQTVRTAESFVVETIVADQRFVVVERQNFDAIYSERELQKSEDFIEGYIVQQGGNIGADYLIFGDLDPFNLVLSLSLFSVSDQKTIEKKNIDLIPILEDNLLPKNVITPATQEMLFQHFPPKILVVEELDGNSKKVKLALVSGGSKYGLRKGQLLEVKIKTEIEVDGEKLERLETVSLLSIKEVENDNFSKCEVEDGGDRLKSKMQSSEKLYCYPKL